ncbi:hypothetical protein BVRB_5g113440 isoform B [Beta vulgaris subsp. vulgaris]|nr:hypothetical protein BVRB_5g113440 isoform B [Beta vulgaris subsp. vulgaris]
MPRRAYDQLVGRLATVQTGEVKIQALRIEKFKKQGHFLQSRKQ